MRLVLLFAAGAALAQAPVDPAAAPAVAAEAPAVDPVAPPAVAADAPTRLAIDPAELIGPPAGPPLSGDALREKTHTVAKLLRCPVCQGLSVADSPSESALAMKAEVEDLVALGYDTDQVIEYFEASYGEFIRLEPKFEGVNVFVWAAPVLLVVLGGAWVIGSVSLAGRRRAREAAAPSPTSASPTPSDPALAEYLRRVREESR